MHVELLQSCPALCDPMDWSPPGLSVHGILQARIVERVAMASSRGPSSPRDEPTSCVAPAFTAEPPGKPNSIILINTEVVTVVAVSIQEWGKRRSQEEVKKWR